ncbi:MAG TPA: hypothetical protein VKH19_03455 [Gemmatimonadaceae bacterium]|nr:hypothetical protein [Gemmatimonadaceae bacterium]
MSPFAALLSRARSRVVRRAALTLGLACVLSLALSLGLSRRWTARATAQLNAAAARLDSLTETNTVDARDRAAIVWGYAERSRLGLESPFRLIDAASRDPRLGTDERRTVAWALLARVTQGNTHVIDAAALDGIGPMLAGRGVSGDEHLELARRTVVAARNPRAAELAIRLAYTLAVSERVVDGSAPVLMAEAAALLADREISRREALQVLRSVHGRDPIAEIRGRRARRPFYVERPELLAPSGDVEREALELTPRLLATLRVMDGVSAVPSDSASPVDSSDVRLARRLYVAGRHAPPDAPLAVTVQRYLPMLHAQAPGVNESGLSRAHNAEMLVAAIRLEPAMSRQERRAVGRVLLAAAVSMRSLSQQAVWFGGDSAPSAPEVAAAIGVADITFDRGVPVAWQPYFLRSLADGVTDLRRVFPTLRLTDVHVRFRVTSPADSALAMHDPRTRTLHLPIYTAAGTLSHELAHDLDRQSAMEQGMPGYQSDIVARAGGGAREPKSAANSRLAASLRALTEELAEAPRSPPATGERPAEIFATRVDWFVASALARQGISDGFLSGVQDELLTGHVVHPERLRNAARSRSLLTALQGMTAVAPFALQTPEPNIQTLMRWALNAPVDRRAASDILRGPPHGWQTPILLREQSCELDASSRSTLLRLAAESRARGWVRLRARWTAEGERPAWARAALGAAPWAPDAAERRVADLRDYVLLSLADAGELPAGIGAYAAPLAIQARCGQ